MPPDRTRASAVPLGRLVLILGMLTAVAPFAIDTYLPAFHRMAVSFGTGDGSIEATLSIFFLGLALGQAIYGPLIDRFGRRGPLLIGVGIYLTATLLCLFTSDITVFTGVRLLQAIGGCAGMVIGRAIVRDLFDARDGARVLSLLMMVVTLAPIVAPLLGGWIIAVSDWRMIFVFLGVFGVLCLLLVWLGLPETLPVRDRRALGLGSAFRTYGRLCRHRQFIVPALAGGLAQASMFAYITGSPFVFIGLFGVSEQHYGWLFGMNAIGLIIAAQGNRIGLRRWSPSALLGAALAVNVLAALGLLAVAGSGSLVTILVSLWFVIASLGFIGANSAAIAMAASGEDAGSGSALIGVLQFGLAFLASSLVAAGQNGTAHPMAIAIAISGLSAGVLWLAGPSGARGRGQT